jgi:putative peptide zinc metalloprotease protein
MNAFPKLRPDLVFSDVKEGGATEVVIHDPLSMNYFRLSDFEMLFLKELDGAVDVDGAIEKLRLEGRHYDRETCRQIFQKAAQFGLLLGTEASAADHQYQVKQSVQKSKQGFAKRLSSMFYIFIPVMNPDRFLDRTIWIFRLFYNKWVALLFLSLTPGAIYLVIDGIPRLRAESLFFMSPGNLFVLWVVIAATKLIHEFSHAYVAKSFGLRVPLLGIGFILFFPVLYCDTSDAWKLADRKRRMAISAAGIIAESVLAVIGVYLWYFSVPGLLNSLAFYVMTVSLISTIIFNGNPLSKFDGYFVLMDLIREPNLATKASGYLKYLWMNRVLGLTHWTNPADDLKEDVIFLLYGLGQFAWRLMMAGGIVAAIYFRFDKALGLLLAVVAVTLFVLRPIARGAHTLAGNFGGIRPRLLGSIVASVLIAGAAGLMFVPLQSKSVYPCYLDSSKSQKLTVPLLTTVKEALVTEGSLVEEGQLLFRLDPEDLQSALVRKEIERDMLSVELEFMVLHRDRYYFQAKELEREQKIAETVRIKTGLEIALEGVRAPFDGVITKLDPRMEAGFQPGEGAVVGEIKSLKDVAAHSLVPAAATDMIREWGQVWLWFPMQSGTKFEGVVHEIKPYSIEDLANSPFSSALGGEVATEEIRTKQAGGATRYRQVPIEPHYIVSCFFSNEDRRLPLGMTGRMVIADRPESLFRRIIRASAQTFNRETLF